MATSGQFTKSVIEASDAIHDFPCFPCSEDGNNTEALYKCVDCQTCYCQRCLDGHNRFIKNHTVLDVSGMKPVQSQNYPSTSPAAEICAEHQGQIIKMYCTQHDDVCCSICISLEHRSCKGLKFIPHVAEKLLQAQDREKLKSNLEDITKDLRVLRLKQLDFLQQLHQERNISIKEIQQFKGQLVNRVEELERFSILEVIKRYTSLTKDINHDIEKVVQMLNDAEIHLNKVTRVRNDDDAKQYITMKLAERLMSRGSDCLDAHFGKPLKRIDYELNTGIETNLVDLVSMGTLKVLPRTLIPFVNITVMYPDDAKRAFMSSLQSDLLGVGVRSKFIKSCAVDPDVYTVVVIRDNDDILEFHDTRHLDFRKLIFFKLRGYIERFSNTFIKALRMLSSNSGFLLDDAALRADIRLRWKNNKYTFDQSDKDRALRLVYDTANRYCF